MLPTVSINNTTIQSDAGTSMHFFYFMGAYTVIVVFVGVIMNTLVLMGIIRCYKEMDSYSILVFSQGLCDLISPLAAYPLSLTSAFAGEWLFGHHLCKYYGFVTSFTGYASIFNLAAFSLERYVTLSYPLRRESILCKRNMYIAIAIVWTSGFVWAMVPFCGVSAYVREGVGIMCSVRWHSDDDRDFYYSITLILGAYVLPMITIFACYKSFLGVVYSIMPRSRVLGNEVLQQNFETVEKQQSFIVVLMVLWYNIAWFPYAVVAFISVIGFPNLISPEAASIPGVFAKTSNIMNPIIYCFFSKKFRDLVFTRKNKVDAAPKEEAET